MDTHIFMGFIGYFRSRGLEPTHRDCEIFAELANEYICDKVKSIGDSQGVAIYPSKVAEEHAKLVMETGGSEPHSSEFNIEATLFDLATGDTVNISIANELKEAGLIERIDVISGWEVKAHLTPKGDKVVRSKLITPIT